MSCCWRLVATCALLLTLFGSSVIGQEEMPDVCQSNPLSMVSEEGFAIEAVENDLSSIYQFALNLLDWTIERCGYLPDEGQLGRQLQQLLRYQTLNEILATQLVGYEVPSILEQLQDVRGDPLRGLSLYFGNDTTFSGAVLSCHTCHTSNGLIGPPTEGIYTRVLERRLPVLAGYDTALEYLVESLLLPEAYIAPGYSNALMPRNLGDLLDLQDLADLIAYMESQDQEIGE